MKEKFIELFEYNYHFNNKLIEFISENFQLKPEKTVKLLNHLINAQQIWNARIINEKEFKVWQINDWNDLSNIDNENYSTRSDGGNHPARRSNGACHRVLERDSRLSGNACHAYGDALP